jgi:hypothetical protein
VVIVKKIERKGREFTINPCTGALKTQWEKLPQAEKKR